MKRGKGKGRKKSNGESERKGRRGNLTISEFKP
jgi:hypothetical protein